MIIDSLQSGTSLLPGSVPTFGGNRLSEPALNQGPGEALVGAQPLNSGSPLELVNSQVAAGLETADPQAAFTPNPVTQPADLDPEKLAGNIISFVAARLSAARADGADPERLMGLLEQARAGVEQGFREAREILGGLGRLGEDVAADIDDAFERVKAGLDALGDRLQGRNEPAVGVAQARNLSFERNEAISLEVQTRDGDVVTLSIERRASASESSVVALNGTTAVSGFERHVEAEVSLDYQVEGHLDEGELAALDKLLGRVDKLADKFFDGKVQNAFQHGLKLGFDSRELAGFSLQLSQVQTTTVTSAYQSVSRLADPGTNTADLATADLQPLGELGGDVREALQDSELGELFNAPEKLLSEALQAAIKTDPHDRRDTLALERAAGKTLDALAADLVAALGELFA